MGAPSNQRPRPGMFGNRTQPNLGFGTNSPAGNYAAAALQGLQDEATFGLGDQAYSVLGALWDKDHGKNFADSYDGRIAYEHARDKWYADHYGKTRTAGKLVGMAVPIGGAGWIEAGLKTGKRLSQVARATAKELGVLGGGGAVLGAGTQLAADRIRGRTTTWGDLAGAGVGGATEGLLALRNPATLAGALGAATASMSQDLFNGRTPSLSNAADAATLGGALGGTGGRLGRSWFQSLPNRTKEAIGEITSKARTLANGDFTVSTAKKPLYVDGKRFTRPDQVTNRGVNVESKAGRAVRLSPRQRQAHANPDIPYRVDHVIPRDVGNLIGAPATYASPEIQSYLEQKFPGIFN